MVKRAVFVPEGETGPFGARETQIELNGLFGGLLTAFSRWLIGVESRRLNENGSNQGECRGVMPRAAVITTRVIYSPRCAENAFACNGE